MGNKKGWNGKPRTFTRQLTVLLDDVVAQALVAAAKANDDTPSQYGRKLIKHGLLVQGALRQLEPTR